MIVRFAPKYLDADGSLADEGVKLRDSYLSKGGLYPGFFSILLPLLTAGFDERECPLEIRPLLRELKDRKHVVEVERKTLSNPADTAALTRARIATVLAQLEESHNLDSRNRDDVVREELNVSFDESELKCGKDVLRVLHSISKTFNARVVLALDFGGKFRGIECAVPSVTVPKIRLSTLVKDAARMHACLSDIDKRIRSDQLTRAPDFIQGAYVMTQTKAAKVYMVSRLGLSPRRYVLIITAGQAILDAVLILSAKSAAERLDSLLK